MCIAFSKISRQGLGIGSHGVIDPAGGWVKTRKQARATKACLQERISDPNPETSGLKRLLQVSPHLPKNIGSGSAIRTRNWALGLSLVFQVRLRFGWLHQVPPHSPRSIGGHSFLQTESL